MAYPVVKWAARLTGFLSLSAMFAIAISPAAAQQSVGDPAASPTPRIEAAPRDADTQPSKTTAKPDEIGVIPPVVPPTPPNVTVMSVQCAVPTGNFATPAPLPALVKKLQSNSSLRILAIGSSSTWGVGATSRRRNYPSRLENILEKIWKGRDVEIVNRGVSGEVAAQTAQRLVYEVAMTRPDLVLWQLGTNDAVSRVRVEDFKYTVNSTISMLKDNGIDVVLVGLQYTPKYARDAHYFAIRDALREIAKQQNLLYVRRYAAMEFIARTKRNVKIMADDNFHLNDLGYECMAEHIAQAVIANLFVRKFKKPKPNG